MKEAGLFWIMLLQIHRARKGNPIGSASSEAGGQKWWSMCVENNYQPQSRLSTWANLAFITSLHMRAMPPVT